MAAPGQGPAAQQGSGRRRLAGQALRCPPPGHYSQLASAGRRPAARPVLLGASKWAAPRKKHKIKFGHRQVHLWTSGRVSACCDNCSQTRLISFLRLTRRQRVRSFRSDSPKCVCMFCFPFFINLGFLVKKKRDENALNVKSVQKLSTMLTSKTLSFKSGVVA